MDADGCGRPSLECDGVHSQHLHLLKIRKETILSRQKTDKKRKKSILIYIYLLLILFTLLTVASYTWFSLSQTPRVSDMRMYVNSQTGLELALTPDAEEWSLQLDFRDMVDETAPLRPVTWSEEQQRFLAVVYGFDGRLTGQWEPLTDERHANTNTYDGYYTMATFYARSGQAVNVSLSPAVEVDDGINGAGTYLIGTPIWDDEEILHSNGGQGAETAVRVGFRITPMKGGKPVSEQATFYIYEPNSDQHIDGSVGYVPTESIDGAATLVPAERLITQTASTWTEAYPVQRDVVIKELGEFNSSTELFSLKAGEMVKIDVYIWLEGQDVDCTNKINKAQLMANIQFSGEIDAQSGMRPIE